MADFEFVPSKELKQLEQEILTIKTHPILQDQEGKKIQETMTALHQSMERMLDVFRKASSDMELEEREDKLMQRHLNPIAGELKTMTEQNETLAAGIVTVSDTVEDLKKQILKLSGQHQDILQQLGEITLLLKERKMNESQPMFGQQSTSMPSIQQHDSSQFYGQPYSSQQPYSGMNMSQTPPMGNDMMGMPPPPPQNSIPPLPKDGLAKKKKGLFSR